MSVFDGWLGGSTGTEQVDSDTAEFTELFLLGQSSRRLHFIHVQISALKMTKDRCESFNRLINRNHRRHKSTNCEFALEGEQNWATSRNTVPLSHTWPPSQPDDDDYEPWGKALTT